MNSCTKITEKKTLDQIDGIEKLVQSDVRKINITDNIRFSRYLFLEQLNNQEFSFFIFVQTVTRFFAQNIGILNLIQSGFVVCAFYRRFSIGSLRMSEKCGTFQGFEKTLREMNFPFCFLKMFSIHHDRKQFVS